MAKTSAKKAKPASQKTGTGATVQTRLALDRFILGLWTERDLAAFLASKNPAAAPLKELPAAAAPDRQREGEKLRKRLFGRDRPTDLEKFEALLRQGVDCAFQGMPVLPELQHDLLANTDIVPKDDARSEAMRTVSDYAAASQVNLAVQEVGRLAVVTTDRVPKARALAMEKLKQQLAGLPHLLPAE